MKITRSIQRKKEQQYALDGTPIRRNCVLEAWKRMKPSNFINDYSLTNLPNRRQ